MNSLTRRFPRYSKALRLYPAPYREQYGEQMLQTAADMLDNAPSNRRRRIWLRVVRELPGSLAHQRLLYISHTLVYETPQYVRRNTLVSALLFVPFFAIALTNDATGHRLYHTWLWSFGMLLTWIVILPGLSLFISGVTFCSWAYTRTKQGASLLSSIKDIRHNWAMLMLSFLGTAILGLVLFHDSI